RRERWSPRKPRLPPSLATAPVKVLPPTRLCAAGPSRRYALPAVPGRSYTQVTCNAARPPLTGEASHGPHGRPAVATVPSHASRLLLPRLSLPLHLLLSAGGGGRAQAGHGGRGPRAAGEVPGRARGGGEGRARQEVLARLLRPRRADGEEGRRRPGRRPAA